VDAGADPLGSDNLRETDATLDPKRLIARWWNIRQRPAFQ
jgi:hypothetical protein